MIRSRFSIPAVFSIALFGLYMMFREQPLVVGRWGDIRETIFGRGLRWLLFAVVAALIVLAVRMIDAFVFDFVFSRRKRIVAPMLLRDIMSLVLYFILFVWAISSIFDQHRLTGLLATGTVLAAVIGLALQDTLGNLVSGISLHIEHTFEAGDVVRSGDYIGTIEGVNWRATRIRTFAESIVVLPNSIIARERLEVFPRSNLNARIVTVGVGYEFPPADVIGVLVQAVSNVQGVSRDIPAICRVGGFGDSSITYEIKYWTRSYHEFQNIDAEIRRTIWYALKRNGMRIPYPIRSIERLHEAEIPERVSKSDLLRRLEAVDVLHPLSDDERAWVANTTAGWTFSRGETILRAGAEGSSMFVIHDGTVSVRVSTDGVGREVAQLGAGSVFGEMALLTGESRSADVVALTDAVVLEIRKESFSPILRNNPELASAISKRMIERRDRLDDTFPNIEEQTTVLGRIRAYFGL